MKEFPDGRFWLSPSALRVHARVTKFYDEMVFKEKLLQKKLKEAGWGHFF